MKIYIIFMNIYKIHFINGYNLNIQLPNSTDVANILIIKYIIQITKS